MGKSNPYKANQHKPDPRQTLFLTNYLDPKSKTFSNCYQSAIKAGYRKLYAETLTADMPTWLAEKLRDSSMLDRAERNLLEFLELETKEQVISLIGPLVDEKTKQPILKENVNLMRIKEDASKFIAERIGKKKYSLRTELTGDEGKDLPITIIVNKIDGKPSDRDKSISSAV